MRISFLPPPLEGRISLGIYDSHEKLIRVLHREAEIDDFNIGADALLTTWNGKSDLGEDSPSGKYHARGFAVAKNISVKVMGSFFYNEATKETVPHENFSVEKGQPIVDGTGKPALEKVPVTLQPNPLEKDSHKVIDLMVGVDAGGCFLKTADGLPLLAISQKPGDAPVAYTSLVKRVLITKSGTATVDVWEDDGTAVEQLRISNIDKMMAFDCGDFELK